MDEKQIFFCMMLMPKIWEENVSPELNIIVYLCICTIFLSYAVKLLTRMVQFRNSRLCLLVIFNKYCYTLYFVSRYIVLLERRVVTNLMPYRLI